MQFKCAIMVASKEAYTRGSLRFSFIVFLSLIHFSPEARPFGRGHTESAKPRGKALSVWEVNDIFSVRRGGRP